MKRGARWSAAALLLLAMVLIAVGTGFGMHTLSHLEQLASQEIEQVELMESVRSASFSAMAFGALAVAGICILILLFFHVVWKSGRVHRDVQLLQEKNAAMEELNRKTQALAHHQRLEMLGTLTSSIAHEFNNMLTPIMGYSLMALENLPQEEEEIYDNLLEVYNASCKAKTMILRLSDLSRKNSDSTFSDLSLDELIQKNLEMASPAKKDNVEVRLDLNCAAQRIHANEIQISQLLLNLILNAFQAMEEEGGILRISTSFDDKMVSLRVEDTGCGIAKENIGRIFAPFFTTKEAGKGTGLGLAIAAQVVEEHRGTIEVSSEPGQGTTFCVNLPRV